MRRPSWVGARIVPLLVRRDPLPRDLGHDVHRVRQVPRGLAGDPQGRQVLDGPARDRPHPGALVVLLPSARLLRDRHPPRGGVRVPLARVEGEPFLRTVLTATPLVLVYLFARELVPLLQAHSLIWLAVLLAAVGLPRPLPARPAAGRAPPDALSGVPRLLGGRVARDLWLGAGEGPLADGASPAPDRDPGGDRGGAAVVPARPRVGRATLALIAASCSPSTRARVARVLPLRGARHRARARTRRDAGLRPDVARTSSARSPRSTARRNGCPGATVITVAGEAVWPLSWYLRDMPVTWASRIEQASTPVIVADWDSEGGARKAARPEVRRPARADPRVVVSGGPHGERQDPTRRSSDLFRFWLFHEIWSPIGSQDATVYVRKDLGGTGLLEPLQMPIQDTSARDYPGEAVELPAPRGIGGPGTGPGQLAEPRGVASDSRGNLYVADTKNSRIAVFDGTGAFLRVDRVPRQRRRAAERSLRSRGGSGRRSSTSPTPGTTGSPASTPTASGSGAWDPRSRLLRAARDRALAGLSVRDRHREQARSSGSTRRARSPETGAAPGWARVSSSSRSGLCADAAGRIFVADTGNHRVQVFEADGEVRPAVPGLRVEGLLHRAVHRGGPLGHASS